jgi:hypothetical protein
LAHANRGFEDVGCHYSLWMFWQCDDLKHTDNMAAMLLVVDYK